MIIKTNITLIKKKELNKVYLNNLFNNIFFDKILIYHIYSLFFCCAAVSLIGTPNIVNNFPTNVFNFKNAKSMK